MNKQLLLLLSILFGLSSLAQENEFRKFKAGFHLGYAIPSGGDNGIAYAAEYGYRIKDQLAINLRLESVWTTRDLDDLSAINVRTSSYTFNGQYYFSNNKFRPFVALGLGWYTPASAEVVATSSISATPTGTIGEVKTFGRNFGFYPRVGFDYGHFNFLIDYNIIPKSEFEHTVEISSVKQTKKIEQKNSYVSLRIGLTIFGGRIK